MNEVKKLYDQAIIGTQLNHPDWDLSLNITEGINFYIKGILTKDSNLINAFFYKFSKSSIYGISLRKNIYEYARNHNVDMMLALLDLLFIYVKDNANKISTNDKAILMNYYTNYLSITRSLDKSLNSMRDYIYSNVNILNDLVKDINKVLKIYIDSIDYKNTFNFDSIENMNITKSAKEVLGNADDLSLKDSLEGVLLGGKISLATNRGYIDKPTHPQQDAVLSNVKSENCFLNIVADGAGGSVNGQAASKEIVDHMNEWFSRMDESYLSSLSILEVATLIQQEFQLINNDIRTKYPNSYSTFVLTLTINDKTIIANTGDSTAYTYDNNQDKLIKLTPLDSASANLDYEQARHNPFNNYITRAVGLQDVIRVHFSSMDNIGQRIILSSDGITDLISEENFKQAFKSSMNATDLVNKSVYNPDVQGLSKQSDNSSAIVVDLPNFNLDNYRRR